MLPVMQVGRVRPGAPPEHDVLHPVGGGLGQARPTNNIGIHGFDAVPPEVVGDRVIVVTQTALSAVSQAAQPAPHDKQPLDALARRLDACTGKRLRQRETTKPPPERRESAP
ncbi:MAG: hypothetical protein FJ404_09265 [Verrucomicrobia bacterium]|nr:hypothetical protein [Verrucomicrobiota bacterium]